MNSIRLLLEQKCGDLKNCSDAQIYIALLEICKELSVNHLVNTGSDAKKVYYISAEFLIGKLLSNSLMNLGIYDTVKDVLDANDRNLADIEELEVEPSLGNGGLGRLAACFLDSIATLGLQGDGMGLNYHLGLFKQVFANKKQYETPNPWLNESSWLIDTGKSYRVNFGDFSVRSKVYTIKVPGYGGVVNNLNLFDVETVDESIVYDSIKIPQWDVMKNLTLFLYPDDSTEDGKLLRLYQQYFMVCNAAKMILEEVKQKTDNLYEMPKYAAIQINDTHPSLVIPEMIRLLVKEGIMLDDAINIVANTCAYTNHTILSEALEKWPMRYLERVCPQLLFIIRRLNERIQHFNPSTHIIDGYDTVHMAHMDIHYSYSVNGVARLHTDILKNTELNHFYRIYPDRFNNKTNGITFRRWLQTCNTDLYDLINENIDDDVARNYKALKKLEQYKEDYLLLAELEIIKQKNKRDFCEYMKKKENIVLNPHSIFDVQVKRLHEYKRQMMNALSVINLYQEIKAGKIPAHPITVIFGAKAAPAYKTAKDTIHLILCLQELVNNDPDVNKHLNVVMIENYNVSVAERLIPAADISEQISLASKEASGTGNMKFMLNGALTLGTEDGANVEIHELVGDDNIFIFGASSDEVIEMYANGTYNPHVYYKKHRKIVDFIIGAELGRIGDRAVLNSIHHELMYRDYFMSLLDLEDYINTKQEAYTAYNDRNEWNKKCLINIARAGYFSSDRTIEEYNNDIWKLS